MKKTLTTLALLTCLTATSCVGPNNLFNGVGSWNSRASDSKFVNELLYLGLWIIPVYEISLFADGLVFNSFEFWGAENPISKPADFETQSKK